MGKPSDPDREAFPFWCARCDVTFLTLSDLEKHLQGLHHQLSESDKAFLRALKIEPWEAD